MEKEFNLGDTVQFYHTTLKKLFRGTILHREFNYPGARWQIINIRPKNIWTNFVYVANSSLLCSRMVLNEKVIKNLA